MGLGHGPSSAEPHPPRCAACDAGPVPDGFDVRPDALRRGAADLRADAGAIESARATASEAVQQTAGAAGTGPLTGAAYDFAAGLDRALNALGRRVEDCAAALDADRLQYLVGDRSSASWLSGTVPGAEPPR
jgi:hypothetical protein